MTFFHEFSKSTPSGAQSGFSAELLELHGTAEAEAVAPDRYRLAVLHEPPSEPDSSPVPQLADDNAGRSITNNMASGILCAAYVQSGLFRLHTFYCTRDLAVYLVGSETKE